MSATAQTEAALATRIIEATDRNYTSTASLAKGLKVDKDEVVAAYDAIEAAGYPVMRVRGPGGGIEVTGRPRAAGIALTPAGNGLLGKRIVRKAA